MNIFLTFVMSCVHKRIAKHCSTCYSLDSHKNGTRHQGPIPGDESAKARKSKSKDKEANVIVSYGSWLLLWTSGVQFHWGLQRNHVEHTSDLPPPHAPRQGMGEVNICTTISAP